MRKLQLVGLCYPKLCTQPSPIADRLPPIAITVPSGELTVGQIGEYHRVFGSKKCGLQLGDWAEAGDGRRTDLRRILPLRKGAFIVLAYFCVNRSGRIRRQATDNLVHVPDEVHASKHVCGI